MPIRIPGQTQRQVLPTGRSGQVFAPRGLGQTAGPLSSIAGSFGQLGRTFNEVDRRQSLAEQRAELAKGQSLVEVELNKHKQFRAETRDEIINAEGDTLYGENWKTTLEEIKKKSEGFIWKDSKAAFDNWVTKAGPAWQFDVDTAVRRERMDRLFADANSFVDTVATLDPLTAQKMAALDYDELVANTTDRDAGAEMRMRTDIENRTKLIEDRAVELVDSGVLTATQAGKWTKQAVVLSQKAIDERVSNALLGTAVNIKDPETGEIDMRAAQAFIDGTDATPKQKLQARSELGQWNSQGKVSAQQEWDTTKGETEVAWQKMLDEGNYKGIIDSAKEFGPDIPGHLSDQVDLQQEWTEGAKKALKAEAAGEEIITNQDVKSAFLDRIPLIMTGADSSEAILLDARKAWKFDRTLDRDDFEQIEAAAIRKYEAEYGHAFGRAKDLIKGVLLNPDITGIQVSQTRHQIYGDALQTFLAGVASEGDKITSKKVYSLAEGAIKLHEISDFAVRARDRERQTALKEREAIGGLTELTGTDEEKQSQVDVMPKGTEFTIDGVIHIKD